jgi:hypothetical protein
VFNCNQEDSGLTMFHVALQVIEKSWVPPSGVKVMSVWFTVSSGGALFVFLQERRDIIVIDINIFKKNLFFIFIMRGD